MPLLAYSTIFKRWQGRTPAHVAFDKGLVVRGMDPSSPDDFRVLALNFRQVATGYQ
jgi:hypothetical protein